MAAQMIMGRYQSYTQAVSDAKAGVQEAFTYLYENTYRDKWYIAQKYMRNGTDAQDVLQDAYLKAWQNLNRLQDAEKFPNWLSVIVASTALDTMRKKKELPFSAMETYTDEDAAFAFEEEDWRTEYLPEHAYTEKETTEILQELMDALSEEQRFCMLMYYVEEHSVGEIAGVIGCSENTVKSRLNYGRKNLRARAEDMQRRGYTLYSIPPVALLLWLMRMEAIAAEVCIPDLDTAKALSALQSDSATVMPGMTGTAAVAGKAGVSLGLKIALAAIAVTVLGGGGFALTRLLSSPPATDNKDRESAEPSDTGRTSDRDSETDTDTETDWVPDTDVRPDTMPRNLEEETDIVVSAEEGYSFTPSTAEGWGGLYSGHHQGRYYYVWLEEFPEWARDASGRRPQGTIRLLWEGDRPYAEGDPLLTDAPREIYPGDVVLGYEIRPGWNGEEYSILTMGDQTDAGTIDYSGPIFCFGIWMDREGSLIYTGTSLIEK